MARVSFTLRKTDSGLGSYLRYDDSLGVRTDDDSALRADNLQLAPSSSLTLATATFDATAVTYGAVELGWDVPIVTTLTTTPDVSGIVLVYSPSGSPQTLASGTILVESSNTYNYSHSGLTEGRWAYYTLFLHYQSSLGDSYYEKAASLAVLVPRDYGSTRLLWNRIPLFYRLQDVALGDTNYDANDFSSALTGMDSKIGPLFKFLSIFGFEMDRMRTMVDYQMVEYDPALANEEHLDALSSTLGVSLQSSDLGGARLRNLIDHIGVFRRSKGTPSGTEFVAQALTGSDVHIDQTTGEITIYSQRVNHITTPKDGSGITTHRAAYDTEVTSPNAFSTDMSAYSGTYSVTGNTFTTTGTGASVGVQHVMIHLSSPIPVQLNDFVGFSVQSNDGTNAIKWARLVNGAGAVMGTQSVPTTVAGSTVFEVSVDSNASVGIWTNAYVEYLVDLSAVPAFVNGSLLAERNHLGDYFDGDTVRGGWLVDSSSVSDYRWAGSANSSRSLYAEDYQRTNGIIDAVLLDVFPITEASKYTIVSYNAVPGV